MIVCLNLYTSIKLNFHYAKLNHKNLNTWKESIKITKRIYNLTAQFPKAEQYGLTSQMRRAAISISSNIAEGASRSSRKERKGFYEISRSSLVELDTQVELSIVLEFCEGNLQTLESEFNSLFAKLSNQIKNT